MLVFGFLRERMFVFPAGRVPAWTIGRNEGGGNGVGVARRPSIRHAFRRGR